MGSSYFDRVINDGSIDWKSLKDSTVLITGGTGLVGSIIVKSLLHSNTVNNTNIKVIVVTRSATKAETVLGKDNNLSFIESDILELSNLDIKCDYIIHCAAITSSALMVSMPVETIDTSYQGTKAMLELAKSNNAKGMVYISSMEVYGVTTSEMNPVTEEKLGYVSLENVRSSYQESKRICELLCTSYASEFGVRVCSARLAQTFGAGVSKDEGRIFAQFAKSVIGGTDIVLHTKGESVGNYCDTSDTVAGILCILTRGASGEAYNVSNDNNSCHIYEMADLCANKLASGRIKVVFDIPEGNLYGYAPATEMRLSSAKLQALGWKPSYSLEDMYNKMISYWNEAN